MSSSREFVKNCIVSLPLLFSGASSVAANPVQAAIPESVSLRLGAQTSIPIGHNEFCKYYKDECNIKSPKRLVVQMTDRLWGKVVQVNADVNRALIPITDMDLYGTEERWIYPVNAGDCEDFSLRKRKLLLEAGFPVSSLLMTVVLKQDGEGHAVLTLRTNRGDYFLDNLAPQPYPVSQSSYDILKIQDPSHTGRWVNVDTRFIKAPASVAQTMATSPPANDLQ